MDVKRFILALKNPLPQTCLIFLYLSSRMFLLSVQYSSLQTCLISIIKFQLGLQNHSHKQKCVSAICAYSDKSTC